MGMMSRKARVSSAARMRKQEGDSLYGSGSPGTAARRGARSAEDGMGARATGPAAAPAPLTGQREGAEASCGFVVAEPRTGQREAVGADAEEEKGPGKADAMLQKGQGGSG